MHIDPFKLNKKQNTTPKAHVVKIFKTADTLHIGQDCFLDTQDTCMTALVSTLC